MTFMLRFTLVLALWYATAAQAATLDDVRARGSVRCGVSGSLPGFSAQDEKGDWHGLDVDLCRAVAAAALGDARKVAFVSLGTEERFKALADGDVDVLARNTTWTLERDTTLGLQFTGINYHDGQAFLVKRARRLRSALELNGSRVCVQLGTTTVQNLKDYFTLNRMKYTTVIVNGPDASLQAFESGQCDVLTSDASQLHSLRSRMANPDDAMVLPEIVSKEPLGPAVRANDSQWFSIVRWSLYVTINAEELGISKENIERIRGATQIPEVRRLLGVEGDAGRPLGLEKDWVYQIIRQVGNYGESFDRNVGRGSKLGIRRGLNALWKEGGLLYAPPVR